ncbi:MAG: DUF72 domain-containing protein [Acidobacteria bacterium]|nr:DUF72 domain-containing protein [Acidobacteriota bacterium]
MEDSKPRVPEDPSCLYLGCPFWGFRPWVGSFYRAGTEAREHLQQYSSIFNAVEGNTTFYSLPSEETVKRWGEQTPSSFRFSFKFPQSITHQKQLQDVDRETTHFLRRIAPLGERVGPIMLQFPRALSPNSQDVLWRFLPRLPKDFHYAIELRHPGFFATARTVSNLDERLRAWRCGRVIMDTRALRSGEASDEATREALKRKPDLPVFPGYTNYHPIIRFVAHPRQEITEPWLEQWARQLAPWIQEGMGPYFFVHLPDNLHVPFLARRFHRLLSKEVELGKLPAFPCESQEQGYSQLELF